MLRLAPEVCTDYDQSSPRGDPQSRPRSSGSLFLSIDRRGRVWVNGMTPKELWKIVMVAAARAEIPKLAPHDLRRTCAKLCHLTGGELDQIQFLLENVSIQTTAYYRGCKQKPRYAVNDKLGIEP